MSALDTVRASVAAFASVVQGAGELTTLPRIQLAALKQQGGELVAAIDSAQDSTGAVLDSGDPTLNPAELAGWLEGLGAAASQCSTISDIRGLVGRAVFNLNQVK